MLTRYSSGFCFFLLFLFFVGPRTVLRAQDCYELLFPGTGLPTAVDDSLTAAACQLRTNLPPAEQAAFRVLSVSEYQVGRYYQATDRTEVRERIRTDVAAEHPFYVLFYWRSEPERLFASLELDLRLPTTGFLSCMSDLQRQVLYATLAAFYPANGTWPAGAIGAFQVDGQRYWGAWEPSLHKFLGYVPVAVRP